MNNRKKITSFSIAQCEKFNAGINTVSSVQLKTVPIKKGTDFLISPDARINKIA